MYLHNQFMRILAMERAQSSLRVFQLLTPTSFILLLFMKVYFEDLSKDYTNVVLINIK